MSTRILRKFITINHTNLLLRRCESSESRIVTYDPFGNANKKDKDTYLKLVKVFEGRDNRRRGHVEFIYAALARMNEFGVDKDLEVYKALIDVLPKGKFIPENIFQSEFMHYPKQQQCAVDLLEQMENNSVMPDIETERMLLNIFGRRGIPLRKYWRMMYWMPKFKYLSPWCLPDELPADTIELAYMAIVRITSVDPDTRVDIWKTEEISASLDKTWVVSAQSPVQKTLLADQPKDEPLVVKGPFSVYLRDQVVSYFVLLGNIRPEHKDDRDLDDVSNLEKPVGIPGVSSTKNLPSVECNTVHEQDDGTVVAVCATGTSSRDSLLSWIRLLEMNDNPILAEIPVIFTLIAPHTQVTLSDTQSDRDSAKSSEEKHAQENT